LSHIACGRASNVYTKSKIKTYKINVHLLPLACLLLSQSHSRSQEENAGSRLARKDQSCKLYRHTGFAAASGSYHNVVLALADTVHQLLLEAMQGAIGPVYLLLLSLPAYSISHIKITDDLYIITCLVTQCNRKPLMCIVLSSSNWLVCSKTITADIQICIELAGKTTSEQQQALQEGSLEGLT